VQSGRGVFCEEIRESVFEIFGIGGITISMLAYVPQVVHLGKEHCSAGISRRAWAMWLVGSLLVGTLAVHRGDFVFIALQFRTMTSAAIILFLAQKSPRARVRSTRGKPRARAHCGWWTTSSFLATMAAKTSCLSRSGTFKSSSARPISAPTSSNSSDVMWRSLARTAPSQHGSASSANYEEDDRGEARPR
jgi:lipid-A-disaccharide synthase-like uncharacterized protein